MASAKPSHSPDYCVARAEEAERLAAGTIIPANQAILLDLAKRWRALAAEHEDERSFKLAGLNAPRPSAS